MSKLSYAKALEAALQPFGFVREKKDHWSRMRGDMWECVVRDQRPSDGEVSASFVMNDVETEKLYLEVLGPLGHPGMMPRSAYLAELIDNRGSIGWPSRGGGPEGMAQAVVTHLPWFDQVRTLEEQATQWYGRGSDQRGYPAVSMIALALTLVRMGEREEACDVLRRPVPRTTFPTWVERVARVRAWLGCGEPRPRTGP